MKPEDIKESSRDLTSSQSSTLNCFIIYSDKRHCEYIENILYHVKSCLIKKGYEPILLRTVIESEEDYYESINKIVNNAVLGFVILDGFRSNVLFEFGVLRGLEKCIIVLQEKQADFQIKTLYNENGNIREESGLTENKFKNLKNPKLNVDIHFSDFKGKHISFYNKQEPESLINTINEEIDKKKICVKKYIEKKIVEEQSKKTIQTIQLKKQGYIELSDFYRNAKDDEKALEILEESLKSFPDFALALNKKANIYYDKLNYIEAEKLYHKAIISDPTLPNPWNGLGNLYSEQKQYDKAKDAYEKAIAIEKNYAKAWNNYGVLKKELKLYLEAENFFKKAIEIDNSLILTRFNLIDLYIEQNEMAKASLIIKELLVKDPNNYQALIHQAEIYEAQNNSDAAEKIYNKIIEKNPKDGYVYLNLGLYKYKKKKIQEAKDFFIKAIEIKPSESLFFIIGDLSKELKDFKTAEEYLLKAMNLYPNSISAFFELTLYYIEFNHEKAKELILKNSRLIQEIIEKTEIVTKENIEDAFKLVRINIFLKKFTESINLAEKIFSIETKNGDYYNNIGWWLYLEKQYDIAEKYVLISLDLNNKSTAAWDSLGSIYMDKNLKGKAIEAFEKVLAIDPNCEITKEKYEKLKKSL